MHLRRELIEHQRGADDAPAPSPCRVLVRNKADLRGKACGKHCTCEGLKHGKGGRGGRDGAGAGSRLACMVGCHERVGLTKTPRKNHVHKSAGGGACEAVLGGQLYEHKPTTMVPPF